MSNWLWFQVSNNMVKIVKYEEKSNEQYKEKAVATKNGKVVSSTDGRDDDT